MSVYFTILHSKKRRTVKRKSGFTLIEILVVVSIISLLASITLSTLNEAYAKARDAQRLADLREIKNALALYWEDHEMYPIAGNLWSIGGEDFYSATYIFGWSDLEVLLAPYISRLPTDPINNTELLSNSIWVAGRYDYEYTTPPDGSVYDLLAKFETDHQLRCELKLYNLLTFTHSMCTASSDRPSSHIYVLNP